MADIIEVTITFPDPIISQVLITNDPVIAVMTVDAVAAGAETALTIKAKYESNADTNAFTDAEQTKLAALEAGATADQTGAEIKTLYEAEADTNAFTDAEQSKLTGIEAAATADQTGAEIKAAYEAEADTNAFTDAEQSKLTGIEAGATADQTSTEIEALYDSLVPQVTTPEIEAGTQPALRTYSPADIKAFITEHNGDFIVFSDINTLSELNAILTDADLIDDGDPRLTDSRDPNAHVHVIAEVTGLQADLDTIDDKLPIDGATAMSGDLTILSDSQLYIGAYISNDSDPTGDQRTWYFAVEEDGGALSIFPVNDIGTNGPAWVKVSRSGNTPTYSNFYPVGFNFGAGSLGWFSGAASILKLGNQPAYAGPGNFEEFRIAWISNVLHLGTYQIGATARDITLDHGMVEKLRIMADRIKLAVDLDLNANDIINAGTIDGRDVAADGATLDSLSSTLAALVNAATLNADVIPQTLTDAANISFDVSNGKNARVTIAGDRTLDAMTGMIDGDSGTITIIQDSTGSRGLILHPRYVVIAGDSALIASQGADQRSFIDWSYDALSDRVYCKIIQGSVEVSRIITRTSNFITTRAGDYLAA